MQLSVIIVNYNVKAYLEQCLHSVYKALKGVEGDVFVVDNLSTDGSVEMVKEKFPQVKLIANTENVGFSRANNQAIKASTAKYVLLLNPDTVVGEEVFHKVVAFMDAHPKVGGLGVKMIDGRGKFLPESKRGLPTPTVAFFKIIGLSRVFPKSKLFGRYHLGHLPEDERAPIEILSGACMFLRKETLDKVGLLDENFFMYGEDIDLSYRITLGGYENWYLPQARIIHYKGESTKKSSVNYVFVFYNAMAIFARKHFARRGPQLFSLVIRGAIYLSAAAALVARFMRGALLPMSDLALMVLGLLQLEKTGNTGALDLGGIAAQAIASACIMAFFGAYDRPLRWGNIGKGLGALFLLGAAMAEWHHAFPTPFIAKFAVVAVVFISLRLLMTMLRMGQHGPMVLHRSKILAAGSRSEADLALALLWQTHFGLAKGMVVGMEEANAPDGVEAIRFMVKRDHVDEVVFCAKDLSMQRIILLMEQLGSEGATFKIAQPSSEFIIGPSSTESLQDLLVLRDHAVTSSSARRRRRLLDILLSLFLLCTLPAGIWFVRSKAGYFKNLFMVLKGKRTWLGYRGALADTGAPKLKPCVLDIVQVLRIDPTPVNIRRSNLEYAKDYRVWKDLWRVLGNFGSLGRQHPAWNGKE
ncbi:MAG: glycosyltransferase [Bacteroidetes bacterium]|nr:glycosyltransferase [Bacteroidota bacterium]